MSDRLEREYDERWHHTLFLIQAIENTRLKNPKSLDERWKKYRGRKVKTTKLLASPESIRQRMQEAHTRALEKEKLLRERNGDGS